MEPQARGGSQMQVRVLPVGESGAAAEGGAAEVIRHVVVLEDLDLAPDEKVLAPGAVTHFIERPPLLEGIVFLEQSQLPTIGEWQKVHTGCKACIHARADSNRKT